MRLIIALALLALVMTTAINGSSETIKPFQAAISYSINPHRTVQANEVLFMIQRGETINYDNCIIEGYLDLSNLNLKRGAHFNYTIFQGSADFIDTTFQRDAYFISSKFSSFASFSRSQFKGEADFSGSEFNNLTSFNGAKFDRDADFAGSKFNGYADFMNSTFSDDAYFSGSEFNSSAYFSGSRFGSSTYFIISKFIGEATFNDVIFNGNAHFDRSQFIADALFENAIFIGELSIKRTRYNKLYIDWNNIIGGITYDDAAYMSLMKNFRDLGYFEDFDNCYYQYRKEHRSHPWNVQGEPFLKVIDFLSEWSYGYGVRPMNPLLTSILLIIIFGIFWRSKGIGMTVEYNDEYNSAGDSPFNRGHTSLKWIEPQKILNALAPLIFSFILFVSAGKFLIDPPELPDPMKKPKSWAKRMFDLERFLGGILLALFLIALSSTMIRTL